MSSAGQAVGGLVGGIAGFLLGGPTGALYGAQAGMLLGGLLDPPKGPSVRGPSPDDLRFTTSTYGANIPRVYGACTVGGNVIWLEHDRYRVKKKKTSGGKGGGSTVTSYKLFATFAVLLCKGPIVGIRRLWVGSNLIYDGAAATTSGVIQSGKSKSTWKLYTGTDTQQPDPRYQADKGVNASSGFPGNAYIVFYDLPLEKYGNSLAGAQIKAEVVVVGSYGVAIVATLSLSGNIPYFSAYGQKATEYEYANLSLGPTNAYQHKACLSDFSPQPTYAYASVAPWPGSYNAIIGVHRQNEIGYAIAEDAYWGTCSLLKNGVWSADLRPDMSSPADWFYAEPNWYPFYGGRVWFADDAVFIGVDIRGGGTIYYHNAVYRWELSSVGHVPANLSDKSGVTPATAIAAGQSVNFMLYVNVAGDVWTLQQDKTLRSYTKSLQLSSTTTASYIAGNAEAFAVADGKLYVAHRGIINELRRYDMATGTQDRSIAMSIADYPVRIMPKSGLIYVQNGATVTAINFDLLVSSQSLLSDIVQSECLQSNLLTAADLDVTGLAADTVQGFRVSDTGPIRASLEPLSLIWPFDIRMHGYQLQFVRRGGSSVASIPAADLDARSDGTDPGPLLTVPRDMDSELPQRVVLGYLDIDREYDSGEQQSARYNTDARNAAELDVAVVLNAQEAKRATEVLRENYWRERGADIALNLPPTYLNLEPADVVTVTAPDGTSHVLRLTAINTTPAGIQQCTARRDRPGGYTSAAVAETGTHTGAGLAVYGPTLDALLDIPALSATGNTPGFYAAASGVLSTWPGALLYASYDGGQNWDDIATWDNDSVMGAVATALGAATCFDRVDAAGTLTVSLYAGTLASVTELEMLAGANHFAYGAHGRWEILAAKTVTLNGDGTYTLQDFLRGRLGTEQYASTHQAGDMLVQLTTAETLFIGRNSAQIGAAALFRPVTLEGDFDEVTDESFTYSGVNLKPLSPADLNGNRHPTTNDWTLTWLRRARINIEWRDYVDVALDEASEAYEVEIWTSGYTTLKRTLTGLTSATATYSSANQVADFGSNQATLYLKIYQLSASVGRGYPLTTSITR